jgi:hypothetical protein
VFERLAQENDAFSEKIVQFIYRKNKSPVKKATMPRGHIFFDLSFDPLMVQRRRLKLLQNRVLPKFIHFI